MVYERITRGSGGQQPLLRAPDARVQRLPSRPHRTVRQKPRRELRAAGADEPQQPAPEHQQAEGGDEEDQREPDRLSVGRVLGLSAR